MYTKKLGMLNVIKQLQHFILCNKMYYGALKNNIDYSRQNGLLNYSSSLTCHMFLWRHTN